MPLVLLGRSEKWSLRQTVGITGFLSLVHSSGTVLLGVLIGHMRLKLSSEYDEVLRYVTPFVLIFMGLIYFALGASHHHHHHLPDMKKQGKAKTWLLGSLCLSMFFSPCLEVEVYFFQAGSHGWAAIGLVSLVYLSVSAVSMMTLTGLSFHHLARYKWDFLSRNERPGNEAHHGFCADAARHHLLLDP